MPSEYWPPARRPAASAVSPRFVAGKIRNRQMAQAGDILVAFWDGVSNGTAHMIQCMRTLGKPVVVVRIAATADKKELGM